MKKLILLTLIAFLAITVKAQNLLNTPWNKESLKNASSKILIALPGYAQSDFSFDANNDQAGATLKNASGEATITYDKGIDPNGKIIVVNALISGKADHIKNAYQTLFKPDNKNYKLLDDGTIVTLIPSPGNTSEMMIRFRKK